MSSQTTLPTHELPAPDNEILLYLRLFRRWWWLILAGCIVAAGIAYVRTPKETAVYRTGAMLSVGAVFGNSTPTLHDLELGAWLVDTYAVLAQTNSVLENVVISGELDLEPEDIRGLMETEIIENTSLLLISVTYPDPVVAADLANAIAEQLVLQNPSNLTPAQEEQVLLLNDEVAQLTGQLNTARAELRQLDTQLEAAGDTAQAASLLARRDQLLDQINLASANLALFSDTLVQLGEHTDALNIVEPAPVPDYPLATRSSGTAPLIAAFFGGALVGGLVVGIDYLDDTFRTPQEVMRALPPPVLGAITRFRRSRPDYPARLVTLKQPRSAEAEAYRMLRTNFFAIKGDEQLYVMTSPGPAEGKSTTVANLAVALALAGQRVLLIDADLRNPTQHKLFGLPGHEPGLTKLLAHEPPPVHAGATTTGLPDAARASIYQTPLAGLALLPAGEFTDAPVELLSSSRMQDWTAYFQATSDFDIVLIDTPPSLLVSDCTALSQRVDATILMVIDMRRTRRQHTQLALSQFAQQGIPVQGLILNRVHPADRLYGYSRYYYYYLSESHMSGRNRRLLPPGLPFRRQ